MMRQLDGYTDDSSRGISPPKGIQYADLIVEYVAEAFRKLADAALLVVCALITLGTVVMWISPDTQALLQPPPTPNLLSNLPGQLPAPHPMTIDDVVSLLSLLANVISVLFVVRMLSHVISLVYSAIRCLCMDFVITKRQAR